MDLEIEDDTKYLLELFGTSSGLPISPYTLGKILTMKQHPLAQDVPKEISTLDKMRESGLIERAVVNEFSGYVITGKGKELLARLKA